MRKETLLCAGNLCAGNRVDNDLNRDFFFFFFCLFLILDFHFWLQEVDVDGKGNFLCFTILFFILLVKRKFK